MYPLYEELANPWPVNFSTVNAGNWASSVPAKLTSEIRIGVAPHKTVQDVEAEYQQRLDQLVEASEWLSVHPPEFDRFSVQFEGSEIEREEPIVTTLHGAAQEHGLEQPVYEGYTDGTDNGAVERMRN